MQPRTEIRVPGPHPAVGAAIWLAFLVVLLGCGRVGYDPVESGGLGDGGGSQGDAPVTDGRDVGPQNDGPASSDVTAPGDGSPDEQPADVTGSGGVDAATDRGLDVASDASPDVAPGAGFTFGGSTATAEAGSPTGGTPFLDVCPPGEAVIGYVGTNSRSPVMPWLQAIQTRCGRVTVGPSPALEVTTAAGTLLPSRGLETGDSWMAPCPPDQVVVGFEGRSSDWVAQLTFHCAPMRVTATGGGFSITLGAVTRTATAGSNAGSPFAAVTCSPGQVAVGTSVRGDNYPRGFGLVCATPTFAR